MLVLLHLRGWLLDPRKRAMRAFCLSLGFRILRLGLERTEPYRHFRHNASHDGAETAVSVWGGYPV